MANVVVTSSQPVMNSAPSPHPGKKYVKVYQALGITQIVSGMLSIILGSTAIGISSSDYRAFNPLSHASSGIWCGLLVTTAGILGVVSGKKPGRCPITAAMVMTIFAAIAAGLMFSIEVPAAVYSSVPRRIYSVYSYSQYTYYNYSHSGGQKALTAIHAILAVIAFIQLVVAIVHSAYCCAATCCARPSGGVVNPRTTVITSTTIPGQIPVTTIPGQQVHYVSTPNQYVIQGQSAVAPQPNVQYMQQPGFQNQAYYSNAAAAHQMSTGPSPNEKPPQYQM